MEKPTVERYFLGANSGRGFFSLYDGFTDPAAGDFLWVIKGGPGCGKSTFMKRIGAAAEAAGEPVEYIHCSGDPDSLDAVWFPAHKTGYVDGTAPHVIEATFPGASSLYLNMGAFLDREALRSRLPEIADLNRRYKALYDEAYVLLSAGTSLLPKNLPGLCGAAEQDRLEKKADGLAARELPRLEKQPCIRRRFLSAVSCRGRLRLGETAAALCDRAVALDNTLGLGHMFLDRFALRAAERGYDAVFCADPLEPEKPEAVLLPEAGLAVMVSDPDSPLPLPVDRHLRLDALPGRDTLLRQRALLRYRKKESAKLLSLGMERLKEAKALHDALEAVYRPHVDFSGAKALAAQHIQTLLG